MYAHLERLSVGLHRLSTKAASAGCLVWCRSEDQNGYQSLPERDEEQGKSPASSQGEAEAYREEVLIFASYM